MKMDDGEVRMCRDYVYEALREYETTDGDYSELVQRLEDSLENIDMHMEENHHGIAHEMEAVIWDFQGWCVENAIMSAYGMPDALKDDHERIIKLRRELLRQAEMHISEGYRDEIGRLNGIIDELASLYAAMTEVFIRRANK